MVQRIPRGRNSCHPMSRRQVLQFLGSGCLGLSLPGLYRAQAASKAGSAGEAKIKACIVIFYYGGPSHLDTYDMKPLAPREVRGEFQSIATSVPGLRICELLPRTARVMHRVTVVRSLHHGMRNHNSAAAEALCGHPPQKGDLELLADDLNSFPCYGAALSYSKRSGSTVPAHVALPHVMYNVVVLPGQTAGFLGAAYEPFQVTHDPNAADFRVGELELPAHLSSARLQERRSLLSMMNGRSHRAGEGSETGAMSTFQQRAFDLLRSPAVRRAFELRQEPAAVRERYGRSTVGQSMLLARRLVEAGVCFVNVNDKISNGQLANWDSHESLFPRMKHDLVPPADQAYSALIEDLDRRGLLDSTLVVALGEFGRTPQINRAGGRDHWPDCYTTLLAGGGVKGGHVYGASDKIGAYPAADPVTPADLGATIFWRFGIDPATEIRDRTQRPFKLADGQPIRKLFVGES